MQVVRRHRGTLLLLRGHLTICLSSISLNQSLRLLEFQIGISDRNCMRMVAVYTYPSSAKLASGKYDLDLSAVAAIFT